MHIINVLFYVEIFQSFLVHFCYVFHWSQPPQREFEIFHFQKYYTLFLFFYVRQPYWRTQ